MLVSFCTAHLATLVTVKAHIPAAICLVALLYCSWGLLQTQPKSVLEDPRTVVEIIVHAPDGSIIPAVGPANQEENLPPE